MENKNGIDELVEEIRLYIDARSRLGKLKAVDTASKTAGSLSAGFIVFVLFSLTFLFISIAGAYALSGWIGHTYAGFLIISIFYLICGLILWANRDKWVKTPMKNSIIRNLLKSDE